MGHVLQRAGVRVVLALAVFTSPPVLASGLDDFLAFNAATRTATANFEQLVFDRGGKAVERASGTFAFARPGKFRWTYEKPHKQLLVGDGAKLWIYDPDLSQVTVKRIDNAISSTPAALLAGKDDITALFTLRDAGTVDGFSWVEATPKAADTGFERVRLG
ncbi:MAG TPA: outer membrane lipoprotein chaperone LolA, partial [Usitatibacter sp.]